MIYDLFIDESGSFEKSDESAENISLVGGIVVPEDLRNKESEFRNELMEIGRKFFPTMTSVTHIHVSELKGNTQENLRAELLNFFRVKMSKAAITFIYSREELEEKRPSGPQFYRCMLLNLIKTIALYHPGFGDTDSFNFNLAHRRVKGYISAMRDDLLAEGYHKLKDNRGLTEVTAITKADIVTIMRLLKDSLPFTCERSDAYNLKPYAKWDNPFMTMADFICNKLYRIIRENSDPKKLENEIAGTFGGRILFYAETGYNFPFTVLSSFHQKMTDRFLSEYLQLAQNRTISDQCSDKYLINPALKSLSATGFKRTYSAAICSNIVALADEYLVKRYFHKLDDVLALISMVKNTLDPISGRPADKVWDPIAYRYHDVCLRYFNHTSNSVEASRHAKKGIKVFERITLVKDVVDHRMFHEYLNRYSVCDTNNFAFGKALVNLEALKVKEEGISKIFPGDKNEILGKIYGSLMQNYSFVGNYREADIYLDLAKKHLGSQNFMQVSYEAHLAVDNNDKVRYEKCVCILFKLEKFSNYHDLIYQFMCKNDQPAFNYHLLLKGFLTFSTSKGDKEKTEDKIFAFSKYIFHNLLRPRKAGQNVPFNKSVMEFKEHPWELVFTLMGRILAQSGEQSLAIDCWKKAAAFTDNVYQHTFWMMGHAARAWHALALLEDAKQAEPAKKLLAEIQSAFIDLKSTNRVIGTFNPNKRQDEDGETRNGWFDA
ncbi:MAG: hypothetical protein WA151_15155, partial [Desulfatirhabdiaceae bacterium]